MPPTTIPWVLLVNFPTLYFLFAWRSRGCYHMKGFLIATATQEERWFDHIVTGFYAFIFLITIVTNSFLFMVFLRNKSFRDLSTYLIVQMAAADVIYLCLTCSIVVIKNLEVEIISRSVCKSLLYVEGAARSASSLSLMLISLERSMSVCSPSLCYSIRKISGVKKKAFLSIVITSLILRLGVIFVACDPDKWAPGYRLAATAATYTLPLVVELIAYFIAYLNINRRIKTEASSKHVLMFIKNSLKVFVLIAVVFAICTLPASILVILQSLRVYTPSYFVGYVGDMIECIPCVINVICYLICSPKFRMEIKKLLSPFGLCQTGPDMAKSVSGDSVGGEGNAHAKTNREINKATLRLDWILGDDPSQIVIPGSPPGVDTPPFFTAGDPAETAHVVLETIEEREEAAPALDIQRISSVGTWPRMRQPTNNRPPITADLAISVESVIDSGVYKCGSSETVLSSVTTESALPKISEQAMTNLDKGTQTDFNVVQVHATVQEETSRL